MEFETLPNNLGLNDLIVAGSQGADHKDFCSTSLEPAWWGQQKSDIIQNLRCIWTMPHDINKPKRPLSFLF